MHENVLTFFDLFSLLCILSGLDSRSPGSAGSQKQIGLVAVVAAVYDPSAT